MVVLWLHELANSGTICLARLLKPVKSNVVKTERSVGFSWEKFDISGMMHRDYLFTVFTNLKKINEIIYRASDMSVTVRTRPLRNELAIENVT